MTNSGVIRSDFVLTMMVKGVFVVASKSLLFSAVTRARIWFGGKVFQEEKCLRASSNDKPSPFKATSMHRFGQLSPVNSRV